jgi:hypothetical protein
MNIVIYPLLGTTSRRAMLRKKSRFGRNFNYRPRGNLLARLSQATGMPVEKVLSQIAREQQYFLGK